MTLNKVMATVLLIVELLNVVLVAVIGKALATVKIDDVKLDCSESDITFVFLGLLGEMRYLEEICGYIPGDVYFAYCNSFDYDTERLAKELADMAEILFDDELSGDDLRINCVGVSLGAQAAARMAEILNARHADLDLRVYLLNPCMGVEQISLVKWPAWVTQGLANVVSVMTGLLGWLSFIPCLNGHSLANLQGELQAIVHHVEAYPRELRDRTYVVLSTEDGLADAVTSAEYFADCADVAKIKAGHCDFVNAAAQYLEQLQIQGLLDLS